MSKITREWRVIHEMPKDDPDIPIRQVYTWLLTSDQKVVIVSKDGKQWQLPGGKPDNDEDAVQAEAGTLRRSFAHFLRRADRYAAAGEEFPKEH